MVETIGPYHYLESGSLVVQASDIIAIRVGTLRFEFRFVEDINSPLAKVDASQAPDKSSLILIFTNFSTGVGHANAIPLPIGILNSRKLYLNYAIYGFGQPLPLVKAVHYTLLLGENV